MFWKWRNDRRSERNLCNCVKKPEKKNQDFRTLKCAGSWWNNLAPWKLSYSSFFFFIFLLDQHESVIESVADFYPPRPHPQQFLFPFPAPFQNRKKIGGEAWVYPPRRVSQPFIFGEFSISWVLKKSKWKRQREKRSKQIRHEKDCNKTMPFTLKIKV